MRWRRLLLNEPGAWEALAFPMHKLTRHGANTAAAMVRLLQQLPACPKALAIDLGPEAAEGAGQAAANLLAPLAAELVDLSILWRQEALPREMAQALQPLTSLTRLRLECRGGGVAVNLHGLASLQSLETRVATPGRRAALRVGFDAAGLTQLTELHLAADVLGGQLHTLCQLPMLLSLTMQCKELPDSPTEVLASALPGCPSLASFKLEAARIPASLVAGLAQVVQLTRLSLTSRQRCPGSGCPGACALWQASQPWSTCSCGSSTAHMRRAGVGLPLPAVPRWPAATSAPAALSTCAAASTSSDSFRLFRQA
jgi:hypothetical protein